MLEMDNKKMVRNFAMIFSLIGVIFLIYHFMGSNQTIKVKQQHQIQGDKLGEKQTLKKHIESKKSHQLSTADIEKLKEHPKDRLKKELSDNLWLAENSSQRTQLMNDLNKINVKIQNKTATVEEEFEFYTEMINLKQQQIRMIDYFNEKKWARNDQQMNEIGRASCRERV